MAIFGQDAFTDTNGTLLTSHVPDVGGSWTLHTGTAGQIQSNRACASTAPSIHYNGGSPASAEYDVQADLFCIDNVPDEEWEIIGRVDTGAQTYYMVHYYNGTDTWDLYKCVTGSFSNLGTFSQTLSASTTYVCKLQIRDAAKKVYIDGVERISSADNAITAAGKAGLAFDTTVSTSGGYHTDNWIAQDPPAGESGIAISPVVALRPDPFNPGLPR